jgi:choline dehydrogenase
MPREIVVCGAGSAGCVMAARLSEDPDNNVLLLEAGPDYPTLEDMPEDIRSAWVFGVGDHDWGFVSEASLESASVPSWSAPTSDEIPMPRGRVMGGSSAVNASNAQRALPVDFARWVALGNDEWSWEEVLPYYLRVENDPKGGPLHSDQGKVRIKRWDGELTPFSTAYLESARACGHEVLDDVNGARRLGVGAMPVNQVDGVRQSAYIAYVMEARERPNLEIRADALIDRVEVVDGRARAVVLASGERIEADHIVVSAGSYCSAPILLRSGIGPADHLADMGIEVVHELHGVGRNLRDHTLTTMAFDANPEVYTELTPPLQIVLNVSSAGSRVDEDIDVQLVPFTLDPEQIFVGVALLRPYSVGRVELASRDPEVPPKILCNFFDNPEDLPRIMTGVKLVRELFAQPELRRFVTGEAFPGTDPGDDAALAEAIHGVPTTEAHPMGTCMMGPAGTRYAVVDQRGAVHGLDGLHVVDASIMPVLPVVPLNFTTMALAERCAEWLRASLALAAEAAAVA